MNEQVNSSEYIAKEIDYLRHTYLDLRKETRDLESYILIAVGAISSWIVTNPNTSHINFVVWLPFILAQLFGIRALGVYMQMRTIRKYLKQIETTESLGELGWESFFDKDKSRAIWPITAISFWTILCILTSIIPFLIKN